MIIDVKLYGGKSIFGGREKPLEAVVLSCDKSDKCSYHKNGTCRGVRSFYGGCKFARTSC